MADDLNRVCDSVLDADPGLLGGGAAANTSGASESDSEPAAGAGGPAPEPNTSGASSSESGSEPGPGAESVESERDSDEPPPGAKTIQWKRLAAGLVGGAAPLGKLVAELSDSGSNLTARVSGDERWILDGPELKDCIKAKKLAATVARTPAVAGRAVTPQIAEIKLGPLDEMLSLLKLGPNKDTEPSGAEFVTAWVARDGKVFSMWRAPTRRSTASHPAPASAPAAAVPADLLAICDSKGATPSEVATALQTLPGMLIGGGAAATKLAVAPPPDTPALLRSVGYRFKEGKQVHCSVLAQPGAPLASAPVGLKPAVAIAGAVTGTFIEFKRGPAKQPGSGMLLVINGVSSSVIVCTQAHFTLEDIAQKVRGDGCTDLVRVAGLIDLIDVPVHPAEYKRSELGETLATIVGRVALAIAAPTCELEDPKFSQQLTPPGEMATSFVGLIVGAIPLPFMVPPVVDSINRLLERLLNSYTVVLAVIAGALFQARIDSTSTVTEAVMPTSVSQEQKRIKRFCSMALAAAAGPDLDDIEAFEGALRIAEGGGELLLDLLAEKSDGDPSFSTAMLAVLIERGLGDAMDCEGVQVVPMVKACEEAQDSGAWTPVLALLVHKPNNTTPSDILESLLRQLDGAGNVLACPDVLAAVAEITATHQGVDLLYTELNSAARQGIEKHLPALKDKVEEIDAARRRRAAAKELRKETEERARLKRDSLRSGVATTDAPRAKRRRTCDI